MKRLLTALFALGITVSALAGGTHPKVATNMHFSSPRITVVRVIPSYAFRPYYNYGFGYNPFYSPFYHSRRFGYERPTELDLQIEKISSDYQHEISTVRHDKTLSKSERRKEIRDLRHERKDAIINAKEDYYSKH